MGESAFSLCALSYLGVSGFGGEKSVPEDTALTGLAEAAPWEREAYGAEGMESLR